MRIYLSGGEVISTTCKLLVHHIHILIVSVFVLFFKTLFHFIALNSIILYYITYTSYCVVLYYIIEIGIHDYITIERFKI